MDYLVQGTIYPDVIESGAGAAAVIKSHHNVGGLPDYVDFKEIIEPLRLLFKDEVRQLGRELGLPEYLVSRQPFPGPGLAIRIIGAVTKEKADTLRQADFIFRDEIARAGEARNLNQYFAVLTDTRSVGVMGDGRTYDHTLALRAVTTDDFMTADWARIPYEVLDQVSVRIVNEVKGINRIVYDITSKPPARWSGNSWKLKLAGSFLKGPASFFVLLRLYTGQAGLWPGAGSRGGGGRQTVGTGRERPQAAPTFS